MKVGLTTQQKNVETKSDKLKWHRALLSAFKNRFVFGGFFMKLKVLFYIIRSNNSRKG